MRLRVSLQTKLIIAVTSIAFVALCIVGYYGYSQAKPVYIQKIHESEWHDIENIADSIKDKVSVMKEDANFIANFYAMQKLLNWQSVGVKEKIETWDRATKDTFVSLIKLKNFYYKLRIIDLDGMEKINVFFDQKFQQATIQTNDKLQNRSKARYFNETKAFKSGEVAVSQMELNMEFGKITYPHVPIVHFSAMIYDNNGHQRGVAVINAYAKNFVDILKTIQKDSAIDKKRYMIDNKGFYLYHQDSDKLWGEQLGHGENLKSDYPKLYAYIQDNKSGQLEMHNRLYTFDKIYPNAKNLNEYWVVINEVSTEKLFAPMNSFKMVFFAMLIVTLMLLFFVIRLLIHRLLAPLEIVTHQIVSLSKGEVKFQSIEYSSNDEIKDLILASIKLVASIQSTIKQTKNVARGDFTQRLTPSSNKDELAIAINEMTNRLEESSKIAQKFSCGDTDTFITVNSDKDTLAQSLNALIEYFKQITNMAELISKGDYNISFKPVSREDRLGKALSEMIETLNGVLEQANMIANGDYSTSITPKSRQDQLGYALQKMTQRLYESRERSQEDNWLKGGLNKLANKLSGIEDIKKLGDATITTIVKHTQGASGVLYLYDNKQEELYLKSSYAYVDREALSTRFKKGEGIIGQVALEESPILLKNIKKSQYSIESGIINQEPFNAYCVPIIYESNLIGVLEVVSFSAYSDKEKEFIDKAAHVSSAYFYNVAQNAQIKSLLESSQIAYEELQVKSEELQQSNVQMEEQQQQLEQQAQDLKIKNAQLEQTKKELDIRAGELEKSSQYKSEFLANMSHELRTPLNSIILLSKMLSEEGSGKLGAEDIKKASVIHQSGQDLLLLINDILDLSKIESGKMEILYDEVPSQEILAQASDLFSAMAAQKGVEFIVEDHFESTIRIDRVKLMQIIKNLLSNAFKFTQKGHVKLTINHDATKGLPLTIGVSDTGIGIPKDKRELIFDAFKQVDGSISRNYGGTGLGLSISKKFTELMGGILTVESKEAEGSCFTIHLPLLQGDTSPVPLQDRDKAPLFHEAAIEKSTTFVEDIMRNSDDEAITDEGMFEGKTILIVDDDSRNIFSLSALLQQAGASTLHALNGQEALEVLKGNAVDLVLMDIMMPDMDGYTAMGEIRKMQTFASLPIIAVTAKAMKEDKQKCIEAGANDYIAKPIEKDGLLMMVKAWLSKR
ncbi:MAG: response regulator [Campylobacterales bacterium]|nr:response regulator [Campylobacterales bacterium]